jgi:hypothetical protein
LHIIKSRFARPGRRAEIRLGEARKDVAWTVGYPTGFELASTVRNATRWHYDRVIFERFDVGFRNDRVVSITDLSAKLP